MLKPLLVSVSGDFFAKKFCEVASVSLSKHLLHFLSAETLFSRPIIKLKVVSITVQTYVHVTHIYMILVKVTNVTVKAK